MAAAARTDALVQTPLIGEAVDRGPVAIFVFDEDGRYVAVNEYACGLLGYTRDELLARRIGDLAVARDRALLGYAGVVFGERDGGRTTARCKDGSTVELCYRAMPTKVAGMRFYVGVAWPAE